MPIGHTRALGHTLKRIDAHATSRRLRLDHDFTAWTFAIPNARHPRAAFVLHFDRDRLLTRIALPQHLHRVPHTRGSRLARDRAKPVVRLEGRIGEPCRQVPRDARHRALERITRRALCMHQHRDQALHSLGAELFTRRLHKTPSTDQRKPRTHRIITVGIWLIGCTKVRILERDLRRVEQLIDSWMK